MKKSQTPYKLLTHLSDGKFHSGQMLGEDLGITRSAVWKAIQQLSEYGIEIQSISGKGYRIPQGIELLNKEKLTTALDPNIKNLLTDLIILDHTKSTNDYLLSLIPSSSGNIACFAEHQTHARGRHGRPWVASYGTNIYHSLLWRFNKDPAETVGLSLAIGVAVYNALKEYGIENGLSLKWPNDILWNERKLAGILLDMRAEHHGPCHIVIGVGINTYLPHKLAKKINQPWVDIYEITQSRPRRNQLAGLLLKYIIHALKTFEHNGLTEFLPLWQKLDTRIGKSVTLHFPNKQIQGIIKGISEKGELILINEAGEENRFLSGEVSLRLSNNVFQT